MVFPSDINPLRVDWKKFDENFVYPFGRLPRASRTLDRNVVNVLALRDGRKTCGDLATVMVMGRKFTRPIRNMVGSVRCSDEQLEYGGQCEGEC